MPRTTEEILAHADELARRFAEHDPVDDRIMDGRALRDIAAAVERRAFAEREIVDAVSVARVEGHTWAAIGAVLGTSGEAARQRYGPSGADPTQGERQSPSIGSQRKRSHGTEATRRVAVTLEDDLDGSPAGETVRFGFDGIEYEIDLNEKHAAEFRHLLAPFVERGRRSGHGRVRRTSARRQRGGEIRAWAKDQGIPVSQRGRIPASLVEQYETAAKHR